MGICPNEDTDYSVKLEVNPGHYDGDECISEEPPQNAELENVELATRVYINYLLYHLCSCHDIRTCQLLYYNLVTG